MSGWLHAPKDIVLLEDAKAWVEANIDEGVICPCCTQKTKRWRRYLYASPVLFLIVLVRHFRKTGEFTHIKKVHKECATRCPELNMHGGDNAKLVLWGMIKSERNDDETKRTSGMWKPTQVGMDFADGKLSAPRIAVEFQMELYGFEGEEIFIREACRKKFDYSELMAKI